jgi:hypothetical protein
MPAAASQPPAGHGPRRGDPHDRHPGPPPHTRGHCGIAIQAPGGWLLAAGDAFFDPREVHGPRRVCTPRIRLFEAAVTTNWRQRAANQGRLRRLTAEHPEIDVFCAHDPAPLAGRPTARAVG